MKCESCLHVLSNIASAINKPYCEEFENGRTRYWCEGCTMKAYRDMLEIEQRLAKMTLTQAI